MHDQAASLRRHLKRSEGSKQAKTISFVSGKGGVGKSNISLNFSMELLKKGKKVLLVDLDIGMGNIEILLGMHAEKTIINMFEERLSIHDIIETGPENLSFIAGGTALSDFFTMDQDKIDYFYEQYNEMVQMYDYIIFDMGAGATRESILFTLASDECLIITTPEPTSITDAYGLIKHIINNQPDMPIYVVMNRTKSSKEGLNSLRRFKHVISRFLKVEIRMLGILPDDKVVSTAVIRQTPFVMLNGKAPISKAIQQVVNDYLSHTNLTEQKAPFSFIRKLTRLMRER